MLRKAFGNAKPPEMWWVPIANPEKAKLVSMDEAMPVAENNVGMRVHSSGRVTFVTRGMPATDRREVWVLENALTPAVKT